MLRGWHDLKKAKACKFTQMRFGFLNYFVPIYEYILQILKVKCVCKKKKITTQKRDQHVDSRLKML